MNRPALRKLIKNKRILIIGAGPSATELNSIPDGLTVFTCKETGLKLYTSKKFKNRIDLYIQPRWVMKRDGITEELLPKVKINIFMTDEVQFVKEKKEFQGVYSKLLKFERKDFFYLKRLIKPYKLKEIGGKAKSPRPSTGFRLLEYALCYKAKEIYLIGIDLGKKGYFSDDFNKEWLHENIDENFISVISKKYDNIYSLSKNSPITKYIRYKNPWANHRKSMPSKIHP